KQLLSGKWDMERVWLRREEGLDFDLRLAAPAIALDLTASTVMLGDGTSLEFDGLVVATGAAPSTLPGFEDALLLRTLDDSRRLQAELKPGARIAVIGAGFIGSEVAATARELGCDVTIVEVLPRPLARV